MLALLQAGFPPLDRDAVIERRQHERWPTTEAAPASFVKGLPGESLRLYAAQIAFPIASIAADGRYAGIVCLSARFHALESKSFSLRQRSSDSQKLMVALRRIERVLKTHAPVTLVVEGDFHWRLDPVASAIADRAARIAMDLGIRVRRMSVADASVAVVPSGQAPTLLKTAALLASVYPPLANRLSVNGRLTVEDPECWRRQRSLVAAFGLAHATAQEKLLKAVFPGGQPPLTPL